MIGCAPLSLGIYAARGAGKKEGHAFLNKACPQSFSGFYPHKTSRVSSGEASPGVTGSTRTP